MIGKRYRGYMYRRTDMCASLFPVKEEEEEEEEEEQEEEQEQEQGEEEQQQQQEEEEDNEKRRRRNRKVKSQIGPSTVFPYHERNKSQQVTLKKKKRERKKLGVSSLSFVLPRKAAQVPVVYLASGLKCQVMKSPDALHETTNSVTAKECDSVCVCPGTVCTLPADPDFCP
ncbi:hypothetical protein ElyMa_002828000 [Elysia marginata]|uniref:Uncharacterized protein n=1 Tax=Elysia marginata TaxID=1093978 RepID=A0AAV4HSE2_9GAST|nr:hypothetical protein ElyMa_002828000 [Elysia marginata]